MYQVRNHLASPRLHFPATYSIRAAGRRLDPRRGGRELRRPVRRTLPVPGVAVVDGDVLIDLSRFAQIEYNAEHEKVVVGAGLRWRDVYDYLDPYGVTVVGGKGLDAGRYGLSCDNVINYNVVLADGSTVNANEYSHRDLFWALKGGGNHFGLVTSFTLKTYPLPPQIWGGTRVIAWDRLDDVLDAMLEYETSGSPDELASVNIDIGATNETIALTLVYLEPVDEGKKTPAALSVFDRFEESTTMDTTGIKTLTGLMSEFPSSPPIPRRSRKAALPGNALGLEPDAAADKTMRVAGDALYAEIEAVAKQHDGRLRYLSMNDANEGQPVIASYGDDNVRRMREVREHYDPHGVFDRLLAGAFKLP
ncbi:hypothetical protein PG997_005533 [Apiospora hydei]|uniref:FAD-binding PCMH-type domain-containing protein n=1 Tax=Apiospora hydei TaxID=1337664 RepID=A0ABR1WML9_9PEZI